MNSYIKELKSRLKELDNNDREDILNFYIDYLRDGGFNDYVDCAKELGSPKELSKNILSDYSNGKDYRDIKKMHAKNVHKNIWIVILGIISLPITLPLAIGIFFTIFALILGIILGTIGLLVAGIAILAIAISMIFTGHINIGLFYGGSSFIALGIFIAILSIFIWVFKWIIHGIKILFKKITSWFQSKGVK